MMCQGSQLERQVKITPFKIHLKIPNPLKGTGDLPDPSDRVGADGQKSTRRLTWKTTIRCSVLVTTLLIIQDSMTHLHTFMVGKESLCLLISVTENIFDVLLHSLNCYAYCSV